MANWWMRGTMKQAARFLSGPTGWAVAGVGLLALSPTARRAVRPALVMTARGVMAIGDTVAGAGRGLAKEWQHVVSEARSGPVAKAAGAAAAVADAAAAVADALDGDDDDDDD